MLFASGDFDFFSIIAQNGADFQLCFDEAIDAGFDGLYPGQEPAHYATTIESRTMFGGDEYLEGFSAYDMGNGCRYIVTYGMSQLYPDETAYGSEPMHAGTDSAITALITDMNRKKSYL